MNEAILKLAKSAWGENHEIFWFDDGGIERFYKAAFNAGLEAAAKQCELWIDRYSNTVITNDGHYKSRMDADECAAAIRTLEMKP